MIYRANHARRDRTKAQNRRRRDALAALVARLSNDATRADLDRIKGDANATCAVTIDGHTWALVLEALSEGSETPKEHGKGQQRPVTGEAASDVPPTYGDVLMGLGDALAEYAVIDELLDSVIGSLPDGLSSDERQRQRSSNEARDRLQQLYARANG